MLTRKHFRHIAEEIAQIKDKEERDRMYEAIGKICCRVNPRFSWQRWQEACKVEEEKSNEQLLG